MLKVLLLLFVFPSILWAFAPLATSYTPGETIKRTYYTLNYNEEHEVPNWVEYSLEKNQLQNCAKRARGFKIDDLLSTGSATPEDYRNSGYDRGHLVPAGDMKINRQAMLDTFYLSNVSPQPSRFNQGKWSHLENLVRAWAYNYEKIWIVTGPVLRGSLPWIGVQNQVSVPEQYFKVILKRSSRGYLGIAFLMSTSVPYSDLKLYSLDIDKVEELTGINFFPFLTYQEEEVAERSFDISHWDFNARFAYLPCRALEVQ